MFSFHVLTLCLVVGCFVATSIGPSSQFSFKNPLANPFAKQPSSSSAQTNNKLAEIAKFAGLAKGVQSGSGVSRMLAAQILENDRKTQCFDGWGCFKGFEKEAEHIEMLDVKYRWAEASSPTDMNVHFIVFNNKSAPNLSIWSYNSSDVEIRNSIYNPKQKTIFIIHGFRDYYQVDNWNQMVKDSIIGADNTKDLNVIIVDWQRGSVVANYMKAVGSTQIVGAVVARMIRNLMRIYQQTPNDFILIGHSLGAQITGFVGQNFTHTKLRAIFGLDPAGPGFHGVTRFYRLDPKDAQLVIDIHTNAGQSTSFGLNKGLGISTPSGHYSFYINGGFTQRGCMDQGTNMLAWSMAMPCSHRYATHIIRSSEVIKGQCFPMAYKCANYNSYRKGKCHTCADGSEQCKPFHSLFNDWVKSFRHPSEISSTYFVDLGMHYPYCIHNYYFNFRLLHASVSARPGTRYNLKLTVKGDHGTNQLVFREGFIAGYGDTKNQSLAGFTLKPNHEYASVMTADKFVGHISSVELEFVEEKSAYYLHNSSGHPRGSITIQPHSLNHLSGANQRERAKYSANYKGQPKVVKINGKVEFTF